MMVMLGIRVEMSMGAENLMVKAVPGSARFSPSAGVVERMRG
jgi:hypothetical protein